MEYLGDITKLYGPGSCLWASKIGESKIAVTNYHFGGIMTREEAAREIEKTIKQLEVYLTPDDEWVVALTVAIDALRAQPAKLDRSRWEGCPNCGKWQVYGYRNYEPAYCRDCGKPLNEKAWAELERRIGGSDEAD